MIRTVSLAFENIRSIKSNCAVLLCTEVNALLICN